MIITAFAVLLIGCTTLWEKQGATQADFNQDLAECRYEAAKATGGAMTAYAAYREGELIRQCLQLRGWNRTDDQARATATMSPR